MGYFTSNSQSDNPQINLNEEQIEEYDIQQPSVTEPKLKEPSSHTNTITPDRELLEQRQTINQLTKKLLQLEQQLQSTEAELKVVIQQNTDLDKSLSSSQKEQPRQEPIKITQEQAEKAIPKPFSSFFVDASGKRAEEFINFQEQENDYDWAYTMEIQITNFITVHQNAHNVELKSVACKSSACEIMGFEQAGQSWSVILADMRNQEWWVFRNTSSSSQSSEEFGQFFYTMLSTD